jgi:type VI secretion system FHA domain protein
MPLTLTVTSYKGTPPSKPASISIENERITIGRETGSSLVLDDPESVVSGKHAEIEYRNDGYYITDTSTNHTLIDQPDKRDSESHLLKAGQSTTLNNNDLLIIGDYEIRVSITSQHDHAAADDQSYSDGHVNPESLFENDVQLGSGSDDPFADLGTVANVNEDPLDQTAQNYNSTDDFSFLDDIIGSNQGSANTNPPKLDATDPFADIGSAPEDKEYISRANAPVHEVADEFSFLESIEKPDQLRADSNIPNTDTDDPFAEFEPVIEDKKKPLKQDTATTRPQQPAQQPPSISNAEVDPDHITNFLEGAGIANSSIASTINANTFYLIGQLLSRSLQGAIQVLWARSKIKSELGMEVTVIHGRRNNPLKFSPSAQESLVKMLDPQGEAYMPAMEAIDEAFSDIGAHEMAVMAGMRSALNDVLKRFNPEYLEQRLQKKSPTGLKIPGYKQAMLWDLYQDLYHEIEKEAQDNYNRLFGRAFTKAYNDQLQKTKDNQ